MLAIHPAAMTMSPVLRALAAAEANSERVDIVIEVRAAVFPRLVVFYDEVVVANYARVAKEFDAVSGKFTAAVGKCDPESDGDSIVLRRY
jgi:hypothetical protein